MNPPHTKEGDERLRSREPSRGWYVLAVVLLAVGVAGFGWSFSRVRGQVAEARGAMQRVVAPPGGEVVLAEPGEYTIYYENLGALGGEMFDTDRRLVWPVRGLVVLRCSVRHLGGGGGGEDQAVPVSVVEQVEVYDFGSSQGHGVWKFQAAEAGRYRIEVGYPSGGVSASTGTAKPRVLLAVGRLNTLAVTTAQTGLWAGAAALAVCGPAAAVLALLTWLRRRPLSVSLDEDTAK